MLLLKGTGELSLSDIIIYSIQQNNGCDFKGLSPVVAISIFSSLPVGVGPPLLRVADRSTV